MEGALVRMEGAVVFRVLIESDACCCRWHCTSAQLYMRNVSSSNRLKASEDDEDEALPPPALLDGELIRFDRCCCRLPAVHHFRADRNALQEDGGLQRTLLDKTWLLPGALMHAAGWR